jgi:hypothetical protein
MEKTLRQSLLAVKDEIDKKYEKKLELKYDYEINNYNSGEIEDIGDALVERLYKCENINILKRKWIKKLVSKNKIRLVNSEYDLDLMYSTLI